MEKTASNRTAEWFRRVGNKWRNGGYETVFYVLLSFWVTMPAVFMLIRLWVPYFPARQIGLSRASMNGVLMDLYGRYFYLLGGVTVLAVLPFLAAVLPGQGELRTAVRRRPWHACLGFMLLWSILSTLHSDNPLSRFCGLLFHNDGLSSYFIYAAVFVCACFLTRTGQRRSLLSALSAMGSLCAALMFLQYFSARQGGADEAGAGGSMVGVFFNINHSAYFLTVCALCAAGLWIYERGLRRTAHLLSFAIQSYALLLNGTFGCYLAVLLALPLICVLYGQSGRRLSPAVFAPLVTYLVLSVLSASGILPGVREHGLLSDFIKTWTDASALAHGSLNEHGGSGRLSLWKGGLLQVLRHPLLGLGPDYPVTLSTIYGDIRVHNEYIQHAMLLGIPALAAYLAALVTLLVHQWRRLEEVSETGLIAAGAAMGYLFSAFFGLTLFYTAPYLFFMLGFAAEQSQIPEAGPSVSDTGGEPSISGTGGDQSAFDTGGEPSISGTREEPPASVTEKEASVPGTGEVPPVSDAGEEPPVPVTGEDLSVPETGEDFPIPDTEGAVSTETAEPERKAPVLRRLSRRRRLFAAVSVCAAVYAGVVAAVLIQQEREREWIDNAVMDYASDAARLSWEGGVDIDTALWYDAVNGAVYSAEAEPPAPYGLGTVLDGKAYTVGESSMRGYNVERDYRNSVLRVRTVDNGDGTLTALAEWVDTGGGG